MKKPEEKKLWEKPNVESLSIKENTLSGCAYAPNEVKCWGPSGSTTPPGQAS
jgi:hypothetical protein